MTKLKLRLHRISAALAISTFSFFSYAQGTASDSGATSASENPTASPTAAPTASPTAAPTGAPTSAEPAEAATPTTAEATAASSESATGSVATEADAQPAEAMDGATYRVRLRDLEQRVDELKEQIRRSHTRLSLLSDTILAGASGGARAEIEFVNDLSGAWRLVEAIFVLDGAVQYKKTDDTGVLAKQVRIPIFSGSVATGDHTLQVLLKLQGHGFGVFSYLRGIEASLKSDHSFTLTDGKVLDLKVTAWEKGGPTTPVEEQPDIRFTSATRTATDSPASEPASGKGSAGKTRDGVDGKAQLGGSVEK